jgi:hypothetical protein
MAEVIQWPNYRVPKKWIQRRTVNSSNSRSYEPMKLFTPACLGRTFTPQLSGRPIPQARQRSLDCRILLPIDSSLFP